MSNLKKYLKVYSEDAQHKKAFEQYMRVISENQDFFTRHEVNEFLTDMIKDGTLVYDEGIIGDMAKKIGVPFLIAALMFNSTFGKMKADDLKGPKANVSISLMNGEYKIDNKEIKGMLDDALKKGKIDKVGYETAMKNSQLNSLRTVVDTLKDMFKRSEWRKYSFFKQIKDDPKSSKEEIENANKMISSISTDVYKEMIEKVDNDYNKLLDSSDHNKNDPMFKETLKSINDFKLNIQEIDSLKKTN
jgi:hypothetical protein